MIFDEVVDGESTIVYNRFKEVVPVKLVKDMDIDEVEHDCRIALEIIGLKNPENFSQAFKETWESSHATYLYQFVYDLWRQL